MITASPTLKRKIRRESRAAPEPGFPRMGQTHYLPWLSRLHETASPDLYFEIGTESGASLALASCAAIAVDPEFRLENGVIGTRPELHLFQQTSDDFFASGFLEAFGKKIDLAFLDGMHRIEFLLRDFIGAERHMASDGRVLMHDCVPMSHAAAERNWDKSKTRRWTGDVWKIIPILREYRPDLKLRVLDLAPSGMVVVENLSPDNAILSANYEQIVKDYIQKSLDEFGLEAFVETIALERVTAIPAAPKRPSRWEEPSRASSRSLRIALKTPRARRKNLDKIVDFPFARALADGLLEQGHAVRIDSGADWYDAPEGTDFDLVLRGRGGFVPRDGIPMVSWVIYPGKAERHEVTDEELRSARHTFFASSPAKEAFGDAGFGDTISLLPQAFDPRVMYPPATEDRSGLVFVGSNHFGGEELRPIVAMALDTRADLRIWGRGWAGTPAEEKLVARYLRNDRVGDLYRASRIVLCDHMPAMRKGGYVSNRIFDALACGAAVISDDVSGLPPEFEPFVHSCKTSSEFSEVLAGIEAEGAEEQAERLSFAMEMPRQHSFGARAAKISEVLVDLKGREEAP